MVPWKAQKGRGAKMRDPHGQSPPTTLVGRELEHREGPTPHRQMVSPSQWWIQLGAGPPPLVTKKVMIFGHKKKRPKIGRFGQPSAVHVHGRGGGGLMHT